MKRNRRVKIIATLGPSSSDSDSIRRLFEAGADVFRINMSHASPEKLTELHRIIRKLEADSGRPIGVLVDLQGPSFSHLLCQCQRSAGRAGAQYAASSDRGSLKLTQKMRKAGP